MGIFMRAMIVWIFYPEFQVQYGLWVICSDICDRFFSGLDFFWRVKQINFCMLKIKDRRVEMKQKIITVFFTIQNVTHNHQSLLINFPPFKAKYKKSIKSARGETAFDNMMIICANFVIIQEQKIMEGDTIKYEGKFTVVPLMLQMKETERRNQKLVVKLGEEEKVMGELGQPMVFGMGVLYSKIMQQYYPMKGIIKVFEVSEGGRENIRHVGAFQIDSILYHPSCVSVLSIDLGRLELQIRVTASLDLDEALQPKKSSTPKKPDKSQIKAKHEYQESIGQCFFEESSIPYHSISNISISCPQLLQEYQKDEIEYLGRELIVERQKNKELEEQIDVLNLKLQLLRKKNKQCQHELQSYLEQIKKFSSLIEGQPKIHEQKKVLYLRYSDSSIFDSFKSIVELSKQYRGKKVQGNRQINGILQKINEMYQCQKQKRDAYEKQITQQQMIIERLASENKSLKEVLDGLDVKKKNDWISGECKQILTKSKNTLELQPNQETIMNIKNQLQQMINKINKYIG